MRNYRSSNLQIFFKIGVLKNFAKFYKKTPVLMFFFNKVADLKTHKFIKKRLQHKSHEKETTEAVVWRYSSKKVFLTYASAAILLHIRM